MTFLGKLRGNTAANGSSAAASKKEPPPPPMTPLQKMLQDAGPVRSDGSDKFFGMENAQYGNTWFVPPCDLRSEYLAKWQKLEGYCNSILQCLYYSAPFREAVINYPRRSPQETLEASLAKNLRYPDPDAPIEEPKPNPPLTPAAARAGTLPSNQPQKPEDKDSPEYKKKVAMRTLPLLETTDNAACYGMKESLFTSLKDIFECVAASPERMGVIRPYHFLETLRQEHDMFRTAMHQDAHEFLNILLNEVVSNVEAETKRMSVEADRQSDSQATGTGDSISTGLTPTNGTRSPNNSRWVHELFEGTLTSETQCLTCEKVSQRDEVFLDLSVDLEQHTSVTSCLRKFSEEEMLCERNKFHCDNCGGLQEAEKRMKIKRLPRVLALHLKRFKYTEDLQRLQKLFHRVVYPYHLRLFNTTDDAEDPDRLYELYAVVVHIGGGPYHGHYVAIIKTPDRGWLLFDDEMVEPVDKNYVRNFFGDRPGLACAYVLFYQETTFEAMQEELEKEGTPPKRDVAETKDATTPNKMNGGPITPDIPRSHDPSADTISTDNNAKPTPQTPSSSIHPESPAPAALPPVPAPKSPFGMLGSKKSDIHLKKGRSKEEKERKAAEREKEKAEKLKRKEEETKLKDERKQKDADLKAAVQATKQRDADLKAAIQASKESKAEEDRRQASTTKPEKENGAASGGLSHSLSMLRKRSGSHSRPKLHRKRLDHHEEAEETEVPEVPPIPNNVESHSANHHKLRKSIEPPNNDLRAAKSGPQALTTSSETPREDMERRDTFEEPGRRHHHTKHNLFGLKKRSFSIL